MARARLLGRTLFAWELALVDAGFGLVVDAALGLFGAGEVDGGEVAAFEEGAAVLLGGAVGGADFVLAEGDGVFGVTGFWALVSVCPEGFGGGIGRADETYVER